MCDITTNVSHWHIQILVRVFCKLVPLIFSIPFYFSALQRQLRYTETFDVIAEKIKSKKQQRKRTKIRVQYSTSPNWNVVCLWFLTAPDQISRMAPLLYKITIKMHKN